SYDVTVTDANGCAASSSVTLTEPLPLVVSLFSQIDVACFGDNTGEATVDAVDGAAPYNYQWDAATGSQTGPTALSLFAGSYDVTATDANGCTASMNVIINEPLAPLSVSASVSSSYNGSDISCF